MNNNNRLAENNYTEHHHHHHQQQSASKTINNSNRYEQNDIDIDLRCEPTLNVSNKKNNYNNSHDAIEKSHNTNVYQAKQRNNIVNIVDEHNEFVQQNNDDHHEDHQYGQRRSYGNASIKNASSRGHQYRPTTITPTRLAANEPPNEARARVHNNLKSNIFFNDC